MKLPIPAAVWRVLDRIPSWLLEMSISALIAVGLAIGIVAAVLRLVTGHASAPPIAALVVANLLSLIYERFIDANGFEWDDIGQRSVGLVLWVAAWAALHG